MRGRRLRRLSAVLGVVMLVAVACGDSGSSAGSNDGNGGTSGGPTTTLAPQKGGTVTIGQYSRESGLDPAKLAGGGTVGGMELMAIYDVLMRYNNVTGKYEPRTAESLTPNADYSEWTLKLRPNIKFTDGTPYDANAVKFVHDREAKEGNASPKAQWTSTVKSWDVVDALTIKYTLQKPWIGFPYLLSNVSGIIYSPAAFQKAGANFNSAPGDAGAGPFKVKSYKPGEAIELERNPNYWGGDVYLDNLRFVYVGGAAPTYEAIKAGTIQGAFIRDDAVIAQAKQDKFGAIDMPAVAGNMINMNSNQQVTCRGGQPANACAGQPDGTKVKNKSATADIRVRQAIGHAIDPKVINDRVYQGKAHPDSAPFANFPWDPKVPGPKYDPTEAKRLVAAAKADGWDGKLRIYAPSTPEGTSWGQAVAAQLTAAGMDPQLDITHDIQWIVNQVLVLNDYDIHTWAYGLLDESDANYLQLLGTFNSKAPRYGYGNEEMDAAIDMLRTADTDPKRVEAYKKISELWVRDMPAMVTTSLMQSLVHTPKLHDAQRTAGSSILFDKAWLEK